MKRLFAGAALFAAGIAVALLPLHIGMTGLCLMGYGFLCLADWVFERRKWRRGWRIAVRAIGIAVFLLLGTGMALIGLGGRSQWEAARQADYAVVLGAQIHGEAPSRTLRERLDVALEFLEENPNAIVVVSGGQGSDEILPEAEVMYAYLEARGADMSRVYRETDSHDTRENLENSAEIVKSLGLDPSAPVIITSEFHLCRARYIAGTLGMEASGLGSRTTPWILRINYQLREVFAFVKAWAVAAAA